METEVVFPLRENGTVLDVTLRAPTDGDRNFLLSSFCRSMRESSYGAGCPSEAFYPAASKCIERILAGGWEVTVAHVAGAPDEIAGWIAHRRDSKGLTVAFAYVRFSFRRLGVGSKLLAAAGVEPGAPFGVVFARAGALRAFRDRGWRPCFVPFVCFEMLEVS
jgi:hypothetical protein